MLVDDGVEVWNARRLADPFAKPDLSEANLNDAALAGADLHEVDLRNADLSATDLTGADLRGANLAGAKLDRTRLDGASLVGADLSGARIRKAQLVDVDLRVANLRNATINRSDLSGVNAEGSAHDGLRLTWSRVAGASGLPKVKHGPRRSITLTATVAVLLAGIAAIIFAGGDPNIAAYVIGRCEELTIEQLGVAEVSLNEPTVGMELNVPARIDVIVRLHEADQDGCALRGDESVSVVTAADHVTVALLPARPDAFSVEAAETSAPKLLLVGTSATWSFNVTPRVPGIHGLDIRITPYIEGPSGALEEVASQPVPRSVFVTDPGPSWFSRWAAAVAAAIVVALAGLGVLAISRRRSTLAASLVEIKQGIVFISYRRSDTAGWAGRIADRLGAKLGRPRVFLDVENLPEAENIRTAIRSALKDSEAILVLIGPRWIDEAGMSRLADENDYVRLEIELAIAGDIRIIPVLVDQAVMPAEHVLPMTIRPLAGINAVTVDASHFDTDLETLISTVTHGSYSGVDT